MVQKVAPVTARRVACAWGRFFEHDTGSSVAITYVAVKVARPQLRPLLRPQSLRCSTRQANLARQERHRGPGTATDATRDSTHDEAEVARPQHGPSCTSRAPDAARAPASARQERHRAPVPTHRARVRSLTPASSVPRWLSGVGGRRGCHTGSSPVRNKAAAQLSIAKLNKDG